MSDADWIALVGVIVSVVAFAVAGRAYQLQKHGQRTSDEQLLNDLIEKIQARLASLAPMGTPVTPEIYAANNAALTGLQGLALEAAKVTEQGDLKPDWFQSTVLAYAFSQVWDCAAALEYWDRAVTIADTYQSRVRSLAARAEFYYNRGLGDDWDSARKDYAAALADLEQDGGRQGPDLVAEQSVSMIIVQASLELMIGEQVRAATLIADAIMMADRLVTPWRKIRALEVIGTFVRQPKPVPTDEVPQALKAELQRRGAQAGKFPEAATAILGAMGVPAATGPMH
jgi:hypothetical protein